MRVSEWISWGLDWGSYVYRGVHMPECLSWISTVVTTHITALIDVFFRARGQGSTSVVECHSKQSYRFRGVLESFSQPPIPREAACLARVHDGHATDMQSHLASRKREERELMTVAASDQIVSSPAQGGLVVESATEQQPSQVPVLPQRVPSPGSDVGASDTSQYFHSLLRNLGWPGNGPTKRLRSIGLTSCYSDEGVSTIAIHTATAAADSADHSVLLVDANIPGAKVHEILGLPLSPGLGEAMSDGGPHNITVRPTRRRNLFVLTAGVGAGARVYEAADRFAALLGVLKRKFDLVLFDMPAASEAPSALHLFRQFDGVVLVVEDERVREVAARRATEKLKRAGANLLGVVLNKRNKHIPDWLYQRL